MQQPNSREAIKLLDNFHTLRNDLKNALTTIATGELKITDFTIGNNLTSDGALPTSFEGHLRGVIQDELPALLHKATVRFHETVAKARETARAEVDKMLSEETTNATGQ